MENEIRKSIKSYKVLLPFLPREISLGSIAEYKNVKTFSSSNVTHDLDRKSGNANAKPNSGLLFRFREGLNA